MPKGRPTRFGGPPTLVASNCAGRGSVPEIRPSRQYHPYQAILTLGATRISDGTESGSLL